MKKTIRAGLLVFILGFSLRAHSAPPEKPKLVVGIMIDQFRYDYLERFADLFGEGGFKRLMQEGAVFTDAQYMHAPTVTAVGHATFMSGSVPAQTGIIANEWYDRHEGKLVAAIDDDSVTPIGGAGKSASPHRLLVSTVADELKLSNGGVSRVIGISMKDRAAILPVGHHPDGAFWFDVKSGLFVTSSYYMKKLPGWVDRFNSSRVAGSYLGKAWQKLRADADYLRSGPDNSPYERPVDRARVFPYTVKTFDDLLESPFSNEVLAAFVRAAVEGENLGNHGVTDMLTISFSCNDVIGHDYGPYSQEVEDVTLRTDIVLKELFQYLDTRIGRDNYIVVFSADHGVAPAPEQAKALGLGGGRISETGVADVISSLLKKQFGNEEWILSYRNENLYLNRAAAESHHLRMDDLARAASEAATTMPEIAAAYTSEDFRENRLPRDLISQRIAVSYYPNRSGDVVVIPKPYVVASDKSSGHGTPYSYDTHVPVIFWGSAFKAGRYDGAASPSDIAPTISTVLHLSRPSGAVGRVLTEALKPIVP